MKLFIIFVDIITTMKNLILFLSCFLSFHFFSQKHSSEVLSYYNEVVMNSEFSGKMEKPFKWTKDMKIYVDKTDQNYLVDELNRIVNDLNFLIDPIQIKVVNSKDQANYFIYFGYYKDFEKKYNVVNSNLLESNWGFFEIYPNNTGIMCVDVIRTKEIDAQKHLLREELTQSLGLLNDSWEYPQSIFYQGWTTTTEYSSIDKEIIKMLYNE